MRSTVHTDLKRTPFELHHGRKPRTDLTNIVKSGKTYRIGQKYLSTKQTKNPNLCGPCCRWGNNQPYDHSQNKDAGEASERSKNLRRRKFRLDILLNL